MPTPIDLLLCARWIIPVAPHAQVLEQHAVAIDQGRIVAVLPQAEAIERYAPRTCQTLAEHVLIPGLVNAHTHAAMNLLRGLADDLPLMRWLQEAIWPAEGRFLSEEFVRDGSLLAGAEMLRGGITTFNDMYFYPDAVAQAVDRLGMRAVLGVTVIEFPTPYATSVEAYLERGLAARDHWRAHPRIRFNLAPHAPYTISDASFERLGLLANELDLKLHIHVNETRHEVEESLRQFGLRPLERLARLHLLGADFLGVHAVHLAAEEIALLGEHGCSVVHCPTANAKLANGVAPVVQLRSAGVNVALGTDGAASNNRLDLFQEMRIAALLGKLKCDDATALPAFEVLRMATLDGAQALGMEREIGSIEPGKCADLCAVRFDTPESQPCYDPCSHLLYALGRDQVSHVWVNGECRVAEGQLLQINHIELLGLAGMWQTRIGH